jgi:isoprenylcysteine carboxyl methyltransferase (ICMT) family protein YpbQ
MSISRNYLGASIVSSRSFIHKVQVRNAATNNPGALKMGQNKTSINWALLLPIGLLLLEAIAVMVMITSGYEISQVLFFFLIFLAIFLVYQIIRQLSTLWRVKLASSQLTQAQALIDSDQSFLAITLLKEALFSLPESDYLSALKLLGTNLYEGKYG